MAQPQVTAVRGIELNVRDLAASAAFYSNVWGLTEEEARLKAINHVGALGLSITDVRWVRRMPGQKYYWTVGLNMTGDFVR